MLRRIKAITLKEIRQLRRDSRMLFVVFFFPAFLLVIFGYAVNFDVKKIKLAVYDGDRSSLSREFINSLSSSEYFTLTQYYDDYEKLDDVLDRKEAQCIAVIPSDLSEKYYSGELVSIQFLIDGVDGNTATIIKNYLTAATQNYNQKLLTNAAHLKGINIIRPVLLEPVFWYNPDLESTKFLIPGLIAMILIVTTVITVSLSLVREKEKGTIEQINVSPLSTLELITGKIIPYFFIALINAVFILIAGYFLFGIEVKGSLILLFATTSLFIIASTGMGILISVIADSQQVAFTIATFASLLPSVILSGFIFPIESMPFLVQLLTNITPAKFYIIMLRSIVLKGVGISAFWEPTIYLLIFTLITGLLAVIIHKKKLRSV